MKVLVALGTQATTKFLGVKHCGGNSCDLGGARDEGVFQRMGGASTDKHVAGQLAPSRGVAADGLDGANQG